MGTGVMMVVVVLSYVMYVCVYSAVVINMYACINVYVCVRGVCMYTSDGFGVTGRIICLVCMYERMYVSISPTLVCRYVCHGVKSQMLFLSMIGDNDNKDDE